MTIPEVQLDMVRTTIRQALGADCTRRQREALHEVWDFLERWARGLPTGPRDAVFLRAWTAVSLRTRHIPARQLVREAIAAVENLVSPENERKQS